MGNLSLGSKRHVKANLNMMSASEKTCKSGVFLLALFVSFSRHDLKTHNEKECNANVY